MANREREPRTHKSTGRRSSILKRQDTCILSEGTDSSEGGRTPTLKKSVSFASTTHVKTFETLPWHLNQSDDSASSGNLNGTQSSLESEVFEPHSFLLGGVKKSDTSRVDEADLDCQELVSQNDQHQIIANEQDKTILFSELNNSDCAMEVTTNVSQLSSSWLDEKFNSESNEDVHYPIHSVVRTINTEDVDRFPWVQEADNEIEKTRIFLSSDNNMETTRNITNIPSLSQKFNDDDNKMEKPRKTLVHSLSQRFLKAKCQVEDEIFFNQENFPSDAYGQILTEDSFTDMEMTGHIEIVPKSRSVLMDLTENHENGRVIENGSNKSKLPAQAELSQSMMNTVYTEDVELTECESIDPVQPMEEVGETNIVLQNVEFSNQEKETKQDTIYMEVTECVSASRSSTKGKSCRDKSDYNCSIALSQPVSMDISVSKRRSNSEAIENTTYMGDMQFTSCVNLGKPVEHNSLKTISASNENTMFTQDTNLSGSVSFVIENHLGAKDSSQLGDSAAKAKEMMPALDFGKSDECSERKSQQVENINTEASDPIAKTDTGNSYEDLEFLLSQKGFSSRDSGPNLSGLNGDANESDILHNSISLSEIAGLQSSKNQSQLKMEEGDPPVRRNGSERKQENFNLSTDRKQTIPLEHAPHEMSLNLSSRIAENDTLDLNTADQKVDNFDSSSKNGVTSATSSVSIFTEEEVGTPDKNKSFAGDNKKEQSQTIQIMTTQDKKKAELRKSLCNEMLSPTLSSEKSYTKGLFSQRKSIADVTITSRNSFGREVPSSNINKLGEFFENLKPKGTDEQECTQNNNPSDNVSKSPERRLSTDFLEDGDLLDEDCPTLEDVYDHIPLNEYKEDEEEHALSCMRSIMEAPTDQVLDTDENNLDNIEFSDICQVLGITLEEQSIDESKTKPISNNNLSDKLDVCLFTKPELTALELYIQKLQEECSRAQQMSQDKFKKFSQCPPQTYVNYRNAHRKGLDISTTEGKIQDMAKACQSSAYGKFNRYKADHLMQMTCTQQAEHEQQKKDLNEIMSDIERIANVSVEIDKCMEDLDAFCLTNKEIHDMTKRAQDYESDTMKLKSQCESFEKQIQKFNQAAKDSLQKMKDDQEGEALLFDTLSFMASLSEWSVLNDAKNQVTFGFLFNTILLNVKLFDGKRPHQRIADISFTSKLSSKCKPWARVSHQLMLSSLNQETFRSRFEDFSQLKLLLSHLSDLAGDSRELCWELKNLHLEHQLSVDGLRVKIMMTSFEYQHKVEMQTTLKPGFYTVQPLSWEADVLLGTLSSTCVVDALTQVKPGPNYITRSMNSVLGVMHR